jgi:hypothetical protein
MDNCLVQAEFSFARATSLTIVSLILWMVSVATRMALKWLSHVRIRGLDDRAVRRAAARAIASGPCACIFGAPCAIKAPALRGFI